MSCNSCTASVGRMIPTPANNLYWQEGMPPANVATIKARIPTTHYRGPFDNIPLGYWPAGIGYGGMYTSSSRGLWNYGTYKTFYPDV
jgi:hypothetical protein